MKTKKSVIIMGYTCNNKCIFCCNGEKRKKIRDKSIKEIKEDLINTRKAGSTYLELIGGEPTIRKDIFEILYFAKKLNFKTIMFATNGRMFSNEKFAKKIIHLGVNHIVFSIHGNSQKLHDTLTQVPGSFKQLLQGIKNLNRLGFKNIGSNTTIVKQNYKFLPKIGKFLYNLGIRNSEFIFVDPTQGNPKNNFFEICPTYKETEQYINRLLQFGYDKKIRHWHIRYYPLCFVNPEYHNMISEMYEKKIFSTIHIAPDFVNTSVEHSRKKISKTKTGLCLFCKYGKNCEGIWKEYFLKYGMDEIREKLSGGLSEIKLELTYNCDQDCDFCYNKNSLTYNKKNLEMDKELAKKIIDIMAYEGITSLRLSGGEPALYKHLDEIISYAKQKKLNLILNTNGLAFKKIGKKNLEQLNEIFFPFNSISSFKTIKDNLKRIKQQKIKSKIFINTVLTSPNIKKLEKYFNLIKKLGIKKWSLLRQVPINNINPNNKADIVKLFKFLEKHKKENMRIYIDNNFPFCAYDPEKMKRHVRNNGVCLGESSLVVSPSGTVRICNSLEDQLTQLNFKSSSFKKIWKLKVASNFRNLVILPKECKYCSYLQLCKGGCRYAAKKINGSYYAMDPLADINNFK